MFISNNQLLELTIENHYFTKPITSYSDDLEYNVSASFLVVQLTEEHNLTYEDIKSEKLSLNVLETEKRAIGDYTYDADDRIAINVRSLLKKGFCSYIIGIPIQDISKELETDYRLDKQFGFDFIIRKENAVFSNYANSDEVDDKIQKSNPFFSFLNSCAYIVKFTFSPIYNRIFNVKRISFKMNNNPVILMKLHYERNDNLSISFPMKELI
jgi:hypothetical protein